MSKKRRLQHTVWAVGSDDLGDQHGSSPHSNRGQAAWEKRSQNAWTFLEGFCFLCGTVGSKVTAQSVQGGGVGHLRREGTVHRVWVSQ